MRHRITLMGEAMIPGAGGRMQMSTPIIADTWAHAENESSHHTASGGQHLLNSARFKIHFSASYMATRFVDWQNRRYRVDTLKPITTNTRMIEITAREVL